MRGLVFTFNRKRKSSADVFRNVDIKYIFKRYAVVAFFTAMLITGLTIGSVFCNRISSETVSKLDFFFITNITDRLKNGAIGAFYAGFASDFLFLLASFLLGLSLWGSLLLPFVAGFKGFGIGISAGYLFINHGFKGILFYLVVLLPGIFLFSMALIYQSACSYNISKKLYKSLFSKEVYSFKAPAKIYLQQSFKYLLITVFSALVDMVLWWVLTGLFNFK